MKRPVKIEKQIDDLDCKIEEAESHLHEWKVLRAQLCVLRDKELARQHVLQANLTKKQKARQYNKKAKLNRSDAEMISDEHHFEPPQVDPGQLAEEREI
jgi:hypothetical protein